MNNSLLLFCIGILCLDYDRLCYGFSLNPPRYSDDGDPAPGRSPGPPNSTEDDNVVMNDVHGDYDEDYRCLLNGTFKEIEEKVVNFTISHEIFETDVLVSGITYQVSITKEGSSSSLFISLGTSLNGVFSGPPRTNHQTQCRPQYYQGRLEEPALTLNWTLTGIKEYTQSNVTFRLHYAQDGDPYVYRLSYTIPITQECQLHLSQEKALVTNDNLPFSADCQIWFPSQDSGHGLVIELTRLNVPCSRGFIHFSGLNVTQHPHMEKSYVHLKSHKQSHLCGKLEELPGPDRHIYFPSSNTRHAMQIQGRPIFTISYHLVDYCYNLTFVARNGSYELKSAGDLECTFKIYLPYGNRVALKLRIGDSSVTSSPETSLNFQDFRNGENTCGGLLTQLQDGPSSWSHCTKPGDSERQIEIVSRENKVVLKVVVRSTDGSLDKTGSLGLKMSYRAEPVVSVVGVCEFGWVILRQFCISAMEGVKLPWAQAEMECARKGGHLASIRSELDQQVLDNLLINRLTAPGENFGSVMLKVDILLTNNKTGGEEMLYAVAKMLPESELFRKIFKVQETFLNEMAFYEIIVPTLHDFQRRVGVTNVLDCFSECLATRKNLLGGSCIIDDDAVLIFENLMADGFINIDRFEGFDLDTTQLILRDMALFHAVPLALRMKKPEVFRNYIEPYCNRFREGQDIMDPMIRASEAVLKENKAVASWAYKVNESFYKPRCASREPFVTLIHTDLWTNNTMQKFVDRKPVANKFIDFQGFYYGSPASDLLFFLWSSVPKEVLELHFDDLIKYYYDHFIKAVNDHRFIDSRLNFQNFMREIEIEFEYEFGHALVYCLTVVSSKAGSRNMNELGTPEDYLKRIMLKEKENAWFIVRDSERRGWLKK